MDTTLSILSKKATKLAEEAVELSSSFQKIALENMDHHHNLDPLIMAVTIFILACFVGYYVILQVTPALHTPLMAVTNAISGVIIVGAILAAGPEALDVPKIFGFIAVVLAAVNIFGGFVVTARMLSMYRNKS